MTIEASRQAFDEANKCIPGGVNSPVRSFRAIGGTPLFIERGSGCYIWDLDGNKYVDFCGAWGPLILGHAHPYVQDAVKHVLKKGTTFGTPTLYETQLARSIIQAMPSIERIRFVNSGTEAAMSAVRLARAYTGRSKIVKFDGCYHGHADSLLIAAGSGLAGTPHASSAGVPDAFAAETISLPFNNEQVIEAAFSKYKDQIAAVIVEPVPANMGVVLPLPGYLKFLRQLTQRHRALLIFDEVVTGFRLGFGGAQGIFQVNPDLTVLGKIIGGGFPVGAVGGRRDVMELLAPLGPVYQAGTLSGNPVAMSAGIATLDVLAVKGFYEELEVKCRDFIDSLRELFQDFTINHIGSMFTLFFTKDKVFDYQSALKSNTDLYARFHRFCLLQGLYMSPSQFEANFISAAHIGIRLEKM